MSVSFTLHTPASAPEPSRPVLEATAKAFGFKPNLHAVLAEAPAALAGYAALWDAFAGSSLSPAEQQVVYLTANYENECRYCMAGHSVLARQAGVPAQAVAAIRDGAPIEDARLEALHRFTTAEVTERGWVPEAQVEAFQAAGYSRQQVLEVILGVAVKTISNYTNHIADTPLDPFMAGTVWQPPTKRDQAAA